MEREVGKTFGCDSVDGVLHGLAMEGVVQASQDSTAVISVLDGLDFEIV